jgi:beta-lactamase regulating signal transducer with metallopeptidase domain
MNEVTALIPALGAVLVKFLWQGAVIGLLAWLALVLLRNARPQARYAVACLALLTCVLVPLWQFIHALGVSAPMMTAQALASDATIGSVAGQAYTAPSFSSLTSLPVLPDGAMPWIVACWAAGASALALRMASGICWVRRLRTRTLIDNGWQQRLDLLARRIGIHRAVALRIIAEGDSPLSIGWWKPMVLIPSALALRMPTHLLEALLAHELAHVRRHDYLVNLLQGAVEILLFYHPVTWWLSNRIRVEREQVADDIAATALGEPRRLALALAQLDRYTSLMPTYAQAANGGHLLSRIQQLIRPDRRTIGSIVAVPLLGLATAGLVFAQIVPIPVAPIAHEAPIAFKAPSAPTAVNAPATPIGRVAQLTPVAIAIPAEARVTALAPVASSNVHLTSTRGTSGAGYALVREDRKGFAMSGSVEDIENVRAARRSIGEDFIWFRRNGKAYVIRDTAILKRAEAAWAPTYELETKMQALDARMRPHQDRLEALGNQMQTLHAENDFETPEVKAAAEKMEALGKRMQDVTQRKIALAQPKKDASGNRNLEKQAQELSRQQQVLAREMQKQSEVMKASSSKREAQSVPREALARKMEAASKPMEAIGKEMEALGPQIKRMAAITDGKILSLIDEAVRVGLTNPAPQSN